MQVPIVGPAYRLDSLAMSSQRCLNLYLQVAEKRGKTAAMLVPTPGLRIVNTLGAGPIRGFQATANALFVVSGNQLYRLDPDTFAESAIGTLNTSEGPVSMASNGTQVIIVDGLGGYLVTVATSVFVIIEDPDFPRGVSIVDYLDGYFVVAGDGTQQFEISGIDDGTSWNGLDFASAEGFPDEITSLIVDHRELWLGGRSTTEVWTNTGNAEFPIERLGNAFIENGVAARYSYAKIDNSVFWLGADEHGEGIVWRANGYTPQRISTHAIEEAIATYDRIDDAVAYAYQDGGHAFYVLNFPTGDATWVYDAATREWHERGWRDPSDGSIHRHRGACHVFFDRQHLVGDWENGRIYALDNESMTDNGDLILRLRSSPTQSDLVSLRRAFFGTFAVDLDAGHGLQSGQGSAPQMMLRYSNDGGRTWSNERMATMGKVGEYGRRCQWNRTGSGRSRVWEVSWTDPVYGALLGATADVEVAEHA